MGDVEKNNNLLKLERQFQLEQQYLGEGAILASFDPSKLQDFMRDGDPKEVLTTIYKIYAIMMRNKDKIKDYAKQRNSKEYDAFVKHRRAQK